MSDLAPAVEVEDRADEPVLEVTALAPDPASEDEPVLDIGALAPTPGGDEPLPSVAEVTEEASPAEEPAVGEEGGLPEEELVLDEHGLDADVEEELVLDVRSLEPDAEDGESPAGGDSGADAATAGHGDADAEDGPRAEEEPATEEEPAAQPAAVAPAQEGEPSADRPGPGAPRIYTRTLGELYARQGFTERAADVFRQLLAESPGNTDLERRLAELESALEHGRGGEGILAGAQEPPRPTERERDEELEELARDLTMSRESPTDVESPFGWAGEAEAADGERAAASRDPVGPSVAEYFGSLLSWRRESPE